MTELNGMTPDNAAENIKQIEALFSDVLSEGKINNSVGFIQSRLGGSNRTKRSK